MALAPDRPEGYLALGTYESSWSATTQRALEQYAQRAAPRARQFADLLRGIGGAPSRPSGRWEPAVAHFEAGGAPGSAIGPSPCGRRSAVAPSSATLSRGDAKLRAGARPRARQPASHRAQGDELSGRGRPRPLPGPCSEARPRESSQRRSSHTWRTTTISVGSWTRSSENSSFGSLRARSTTTAAPGPWPSPRRTPCAATRGSVHAYAEEARKGLRGAASCGAGRSRDAGLSLGLSLAYLGRKQEAIQEGERAVALSPFTKDARSGAYYQHQLVRISILAGEPEKALDQLEALLKIPYYLSPDWLRIDPNFDPLRRNPRFQKLVAGRASLIRGWRCNLGHRWHSPRAPGSAPTRSCRRSAPAGWARSTGRAIRNSTGTSRSRFCPALSPDPDVLARFEREAKAVAALSHPNILAIHDFGTHEGVSYAVMELLRGRDAARQARRGPLPAEAGRGLRAPDRRRVSPPPTTRESSIAT